MMETVTLPPPLSTKRQIAESALIRLAIEVARARTWLWGPLESLWKWSCFVGLSTVIRKHLLDRFWLTATSWIYQN